MGLVRSRARGFRGSNGAWKFHVFNDQIGGRISAGFHRDDGSGFATLKEFIVRIFKLLVAEELSKRLPA